VPDERRTCGKLELNWNYAQAVADAGGVPLLIPPHADPAAVADIIDGWLIPGGNDIDASYWGEQNHPKVKPIEDSRFQAERRLYKHANPTMPVLGICYGCQFINIERGGSLYQHLPDVIGHDRNSGGTMQQYELDPDSQLKASMGDERVRGESWHHQSIRDTGKNLRVVAEGEDGVIEGVEATDRPWLVGVQWHPERTPEDEATQRLFRSFVQACAEYAQKRRS
jgi:putative glutamine amidotransferase